jgi:ribonuclease-3
MSTSKTNILKNNSINDSHSDSDSSTELNDDTEYMIKADKKIYPVYNENNFYITKEIIQSILKKADINIEINNLNLWQQAFIHKSYCKNNDFLKNEKFYGNIDAFDIENSDYKHIMRLQDDSNEVIEWLGDGIIQSVVAIYLYQRYKNQREGFLTKIRSKLVKTETLSKLALYLNFDKYLIVSKHIEVICNGRKNSRILEDSFEAFVGALYNDFSTSLGHAESYNLCSKFIINLIEKNIDITELIINDDNYKDQLMRYYQKTYNGKFPVYEQKTLITSINDNGIVNKKFHMFVRDIDNNIIGEGIARSKKEAEQKAANAALKFFGISNGY